MKKVVFILVALMACCSAAAQLPDIKKTTWYLSHLADLNSREIIPETGDTVIMDGLDGTTWIVGDHQKLYRVNDGYEYPGGYVNRNELTVVGKNHHLIEFLEEWATSVNKIQSKYKLILNADWYINRYGGITCHLFAINNYNKPIKYITVNYRAYNPVDDPCKIGKSYTSYIKCVGPIESGFEGSYEFDSPVGYTSYDASNIKITSVNIQFMDNTKVTLTKPSQYTVSDTDNLDYYKYLMFKQDINK